LVQEADGYASQGAASGQAVAPIGLAEVTPKHRLFEIALAHAHALVGEIGNFAESIGHFDNLDPLFAECVLEFVKYYWLANRQPQYRDWKRRNQPIFFGTVAEPISRGAKIAIIGDWGTGMPDAKLLLAELLTKTRPDVLIHLGDVYYSGTPAEFQHNFSEVLGQVLAENPGLGLGPRIYAIPGNHDYYAGSGPFYRLIDSLNAGPAKQTASYFCLRSEDDRWQVIGVDTGFNDRSPGLAFDKAYLAPIPQPSEVEWLQDKLATFPGRTILMSHHQAFSSHAGINGPESGRPQYLNQPLIDSVGPHLDRVAAWLWGHEHNLVLFAPNQFGVTKGRLVGCSAFEMTPADDPYSIVFDKVSALDARLHKTEPWFNHGCALIDLDKSEITYYEMASWLGVTPVPTPVLRELTREAL
jgi:hypothetical protein